HVETILESGNKLAAILQDALDYSKIEAGKLELEHVPFSIERALVSVKRIFEPKAREKGLVLETWLDPELPSAVLGDPLRLRQVLMNLVSNAIKFTENGTIRIEAKRMARSAATSTEIDIFYRVSDTGIGMDPAASNRLFRRYTQLESSTSRRYGGTGLGLSISQGLVQAMGGKIELESAVGKGSSFFFTVTVESAEADHEEETNFFPTFEALKPRILVADDNRVNRKVADAMLVKLGCEVTLASSGKQAISILESSPFDLILMDCHMPEMDGFDASRIIRSWSTETDEIKRSASTTPIVALTADVLPGIRERCLDAKMNGMISKPFRQEELAKEIARWIGNRQ
ncbi:MAG: ATP-binding protein, partial [Fibrobacterota bacterium]